jgi:hypothetical protein
MLAPKVRSPQLNMNTHTNAGSDQEEQSTQGICAAELLNVEALHMIIWTGIRLQLLQRNCF